MAFTIEKILSDARMLCTRLKDHDSSADTLIEQAHNLNSKVEAMQTYQEDLNELNELARHRPRSNLIMGLVQESNQIRELQQENKELRVALEEHQSALELIMSKYREQVVKLIMVNKLQAKKDGMNNNSALDQEIKNKMDKICEMAAVMQKAIALDETSSQHYQETVSRLVQENRTLRDLLNTALVNVPKPETADMQIQTSRSYKDEDEGQEEEEDDRNSNISSTNMDDSYMDNSFDNPMQRSVIEVFPMNKTASSASEIEDQDENANSSSGSSENNAIIK